MHAGVRSTQYDSNRASRIAGIVCTYNRSDLLGSVFEGLLGQTLPPELFEIVVVDDGSTEDLTPLIERYARRLPIQYVRQDNLGLAAAKNAGVAASSAPIVLFMDDDDVPSPRLLEEHLRTHDIFPDDRIAVLGHTNLHPTLSNDPLMRFVTETGCYLFSYGRICDGDVLDYTWFWGGRSSCKRSILPDRDPFNPLFRFGCEDIELGYRLSGRGLKVVYNCSAVTTMVRAFDIEGFCRRTELQGRSNWLFSRLHPAREVQAWAEIQDAPQRWQRLRTEYNTIVETARRIDSLARIRLTHEIASDEVFETILYRAYWDAFGAARLKGMASAAEETSTAPKQSDSIPA